MANTVIVEVSTDDGKHITRYSVEGLYKPGEESDDATFYDGSMDAEPQERSYPCEHCARSFSRKGDMVRHVRTHTGEKPFSCPECGDDFSRKDDMVRHLRTHTGVKPFPCLLCHKNFGRKSDLDKHHLTHEGKDLYCPKCDAIFLQKSIFLTHVQTHAAEENGLPCNECGHLFPRRKGMVRLCKRNGELKRYICVDCRKKRPPDGSSSEKPFVCPECGDSFGRKADMVRHLRLHTGIKPYPCPTCFRPFSRKEDMVRHYLTHAASKLRSCPSCGKGFTKKSDFDSHIASATCKKKKRCSFDVDEQSGT